MMNRLSFGILTTLALSVALLFFINAWQGFRYERLMSEVHVLERQQEEWLDKNKKSIIRIAILRSPRRIENIVEETLQIERGNSPQLMTITFAERMGVQTNRIVEETGWPSASVAARTTEEEQE